MLLPLALALVLSCGEKTPPVSAADTVQPPAPSNPVAAEVLASMDLTADPCMDFYQYACGGWLDATPLPSDKPVWSRSFSVINERNREFLRELLDRAAADPGAGDADWQRMGHVYGACMDEEAGAEQGLAPFERVFEQIEATSDAEDLARTLGELERLGVSTIAGIWVDGDFTDPGLAIIHLSQAGLSLPDRDYYLKEDDDSKQLLADYQAWLASTLAAVGTEDEAEALAGEVLALETAIAELHWEKELLRDPEKTYHKIDRAGLVALNPGFPWETWLATVEAEGVDDINVSTPEPIQQQADLLLATLAEEPEVLRAWLKLKVLGSFRSHLPEPYYGEAFAFFNARVYGQQQPEPRWKRCVDTANGTVGELVGRFYVEERFPGDSKDKALALIEGIQDSFEASLPELEWMDEETRAAAIEKKDLLGNKIGYPDTWRDYSALQTGADTHLVNMMGSRQVEHGFWLEQAGEPVDKSIWFMAASQVNAYYHPIRAEMVFPAGILQPPFFSRDFPMAMNFGGIGMVMGHELTHGFDDSGRKFDGHGKMVEWWPAEVAAAFEERAQCVDDAYSAFQVAEGLPVNGKMTLGENIADIGGTRQAFHAYRAWVEANGEEQQLLEELTNEQLFFVAMAQGWCTVAAPEFEKMMVMSNSHSPARFRVIGPAMHLEEFREAFSCEAGEHAMVAEPTCEVW